MIPLQAEGISHQPSDQELDLIAQQLALRNSLKPTIIRGYLGKFQLWQPPGLGQELPYNTEQVRRYLTQLYVHQRRWPYYYKQQPRPCETASTQLVAWNFQYTSPLSVTNRLSDFVMLCTETSLYNEGNMQRRPITVPIRMGTYPVRRFNTGEVFFLCAPG